MGLTVCSEGSGVSSRGGLSRHRKRTASETGQHATASACYTVSGHHLNGESQRDARLASETSSSGAGRLSMNPTKTQNPSVAAQAARAAKPGDSTSGNMEKGNPADIRSIRAAYRDGLNLGAIELRTRKIAGSDAPEKLLACLHTADALARTYTTIGARLDPPAIVRAAQWRGIADAYALAANVPDDRRVQPLAFASLELREPGTYAVIQEARHG